MQPLRWERRPDGLRAPALVCAFKGWNDAGESATAALSFLGTSLDAQRFATIDPEEFVDFQSTRPTVRLRGGLTRHIDWPEFEVYEARIPRAPRDLILLSGPEPAIRWRTFCQTVIDLSEALGVQMLTSLGALLADVPHSRPVSVTGIASDESLVERLGLSASRYEGPTGIVGVLQDACVAAGIPAISFWAGVPHYVSQPPNPKATLALLHSVEEVLDLPVPLAELPQQSDEWQKLVDEMAAEDDEVTDYIRNLEERDDEIDRSELGEASGDAIAREFERYLRRRDRGGGHAGPGAHG
jgi:proteasome assembly chaperone (PAC2) family protein